MDQPGLQENNNGSQHSLTSNYNSEGEGTEKAGAAVLSFNGEVIHNANEEGCSAGQQASETQESLEADCDTGNQGDNEPQETRAPASADDHARDKHESQPSDLPSRNMDAHGHSHATENGQSPEHRGYLENMGTRLSELVERLASEQKIFKETHLKEYEGLPNLKHVLGDTSSICKEYHDTIGQLSWYIGQLRELLTGISHSLERKLGDEGLFSWLEGNRAHPADVYGVANEKSLLAKAAEARSAVARTKVDTIKAEELAAKLELEAAETAEEARKAAADAEVARREAAEAKRAAEAKAKADEEAKRKAAEEKKKKDEEEKRKREIEAKQRAEEERLAGSPEEQERLRKEAERKNPKNWPVMVYSVEPGDIDIPVGCVVRALPGSVTRDRLVVESLEQITGVLPLQDNEELVSNIIRLDFDQDLQFEEPLAVAIPHCMPRNFAREPVIKVLQDNSQWKELSTHEVSFDDIKDFKFVEVRLKSPGTLAVVTRFKRDELHVLRKGGKVSPSVDSRIVFNFRPTTFRANSILNCEVQPVELSAVSDVKHRYSAECGSLLASSPLVSLDLRGRVLSKPLLVSVPVPPPPTKAKRPGTAAPDTRNGKARKGIPSGGVRRPVSAFGLGIPKEDEEEGDSVSLLYKDNEGKWTVMSDVSIAQSKNKDIATFEMKTVPRKFWLLRTKPDLADEAILKMAKSFDNFLKHRVVQLLLRQRSEEPREVIILGTSVQRSERYQRNLTEEGFDAGPPPSPELVVREGQTMEIRFRGNIKDEEDMTETLQMVYNSHIRTRMEFMVREIDRFAQKGIDCYRGFAQVYTRGLVAIEVPIDGEKDKKNPKQALVKTIYEEGDQLLCEMLINLPKPAPEPPKPLPRAPLNLKTDGLVDEKLLRALAVDLGDEWRRLAHYLNVRRVRIQSIMRNNINGVQENIIYDMLLTWAKRVPHSMNKVDLLCRALIRIGRFDLAEEIRDKEQDFNQVRAQSSRDSYLRKSFVKVAQHEHVVSDWKYLSRELGVNESDILQIEGEFSSMRDRCFQSLMRWRTICNGEASVDLLARHLRKCRYHDVAEQIKLVC